MYRLVIPTELVISYVVLCHISCKTITVQYICHLAKLAQLVTLSCHILTRY